MTPFTVTLKRYFYCFIIGVVPITAGLFVSKKHSFMVLLTFKYFMPTSLGALYLYGMQKWISYKLGLINTSISIESEELAELKGKDSGSKKSKDVNQKKKRK